MSANNAGEIASDLTDRLREAGTVAIPTGPMADGDEREVDLPPFTVETHDTIIDGLGAVTVVEVELDMQVSTYRFLNDPDNPEQRSPAEAIYAAMDDVGIRRPNATPELGVQLGSVGFEDDGTPYPAKDHVTVQGYLPQEGSAQTDGGVLAGIPVVETGMTLSAFLAAAASLGAVGMARLLTDLGEEYTIKNDLDAADFDIGVYDDAAAGATGDSVSDTSDLAALTSEPTDGNYARQDELLSADDLSGNWGTDTDTDTVFDMTNTTGPVDSWFAEVNFTAVDTSDGAGTDHLLCTGALSQEYDLGNLTQLTITAGGVGWTVT